MNFPFPVSPEDAQVLKALINKIALLRQEDVGPFPSADIRHIYKTVTSRKIQTRQAIDKGFSADFDYYWSNVTGCCSWGEKVFQWPSADRKRRAYWLGKPFFERWPQYLLVRRWITAENTPDLYHDFMLYEEMRVNVLALISILEKLQNTSEKP